MSFWKGKSVLVTGASGLLGNSLSRNLAEKGAKLFLLVRHQRNLSVEFPHATIIVASLNNENELHRSLNKNKFDCVFHMAGQSQVSHKDLADTYSSNTLGTLNLLQALIENKHKGLFMHASSMACSQEQKVRENAYVGSKKSVEYLVENYRHAYGLHAFSLRFPNVYGPADRNLSRIVPAIINSLLTDRELVLKSPSTTELNLLYVDDAVSAALDICQHFLQVNSSESLMSVCHPKNVSSAELITEVGEILGTYPKVKETCELSSCNNVIQLESHSAVAITDLLNWIPVVSLRQGLKNTVDWYKNKYIKTEGQTK